MPLSEPALSKLVVLFLAFFVLIGVHPALQKAMQKLKKLLAAGAEPKEKLTPSNQELHAAIFADQVSTHALNDFEIIVLRRIAQNHGKPLTRKQVNETLLFGPAILNKTLKSLARREYVQVRISKLLGVRFALTEAGRRYALDQGYIVQLHMKSGKLSW